MPVRITKLNAEGDPAGEAPTPFATVEQAQKWAVEDRGQPLLWGEEGRFFSLEGITEEELDLLSEEGSYPPIRYWLHGVDENGEDRELEDSDFEHPETIVLERN